MVYFVFNLYILSYVGSGVRRSKLALSIDREDGEKFQSQKRF
jgi:hypothetical protein